MRSAMSSILNELDADQVRQDASDAREDPSKCVMVRKLNAQWVGGTRARVFSGEKEIYIGGQKDFGAMSAALASLLACEIDLLATQATVRGIELEKLSIEASGDFNAARYLAGGEGPSPGFQKVEYTLTIRSKNATHQQLQDLAKLCESSSPVGDTFARPVPISMRIVIE